MEMFSLGVKTFTPLGVMLILYLHSVSLALLTVTTERTHAHTCTHTLIIMAEETATSKLRS